MTKYYQAVGTDLSKARGGPDRKKGGALLCFGIGAML